MEINLQHQKQNPLLNRTEIEAELSYEAATPSIADIKKLLASHFKTDENAIIINHVYGQFGKTKAKVIASLYKDAASLDKIEKISKKPKKAKAAEAQQAKK